MVNTCIFLLVVFIISTVVFVGVNFGNGKLAVKGFLKHYFFFVLILFLPSLTGYILRWTGSTWLLIFLQAYAMAVGVWIYFDYKKNYEKVYFRPELSKYLFGIMLCSLTGILFAYSFNFFAELVGTLRVRTGLGLGRKILRNFDKLNQMDIGAYMVGGLIMYFVPFIMIDTFNRLLLIPKPVFKKWTYPKAQIQRDLDSINPDKLGVIELEVAKNPGDKVRANFQLKSPFDLEFGLVFYKFINDYNYKFPETPFDHSGTEEKPFGWTFYKKPGFLGGKNYIDPDLTLVNNRVKEYKVIVAQRELLESDD